MKLVALESPLRANIGAYTREQHRRYLLAGIEDCFARGEAPYCSHFYADVLDDDNPQHRHAGMAAGLLWSSKCHYAVILRDLGISDGMRDAMKHYDQLGIRWEWRSLGPKVIKMIQEMASDSAAYAEPELTDFS